MSRYQITTPAPHHSVFYRPVALPAAQPTASKHWRQVKIRYKNSNKSLLTYSPIIIKFSTVASTRWTMQSGNTWQVSQVVVSRCARSQQTSSSGHRSETSLTEVVTSACDPGYRQPMSADDVDHPPGFPHQLRWSLQQLSLRPRRGGNSLLSSWRKASFPDLMPTACQLHHTVRYTTQA